MISVQQASRRVLNRFRVRFAILTVISKFVLVDNATLPLPCDVGDPYTSHSNAVFAQLRDEILPQRLIELLKTD